jgi:hypothetical protein
MIQAKPKKKKSLKKIFTLFLLPVYAAFGYFAPFFLICGPIVGVVAFFKLAYIDREGPVGYRKLAQLLLSLPRGVVVGTLVAAALFAPMRGLAFLISKYSDINMLQELFNHFSVNGLIDAWFGLIGVVFTISAGFYAWSQGLRIKTQIENIPTSKAHAAALGLAEFKGVARAIEDRQMRMTEILVNGETRPTVPGEIIDDGTEMPILFERWIKESESQRIIEIRSRFYLEDDSGRILVDPRGVLFWNGKVDFFSPSARSIYLERRFESGSKKVAFVETRQLNPGDQIYLIGSVEEQNDTTPSSFDAQRLVVRPSSVLKSTNLLRRLILGKGEKTSGSDIYDVFFLTDLKELNAAELLIKGIGNIWLWVAVFVCLSAPLLVEYWNHLFSVT